VNLHSLHVQRPAKARSWRGTLRGNSRLPSAL
jgi:hypothetical protein